MAAPTASATLNKSAYTPGELMTLTVDHSDVDRATINVSGVVTDSTGATGSWGPVTAVIDAGVVTVTNGGGKTWTVQSATTNRTVFTATA